MVEQRRTKKESLISASKWGAIFLGLICVMGYFLYTAVVGEDPKAGEILIFQFKFSVPLFTLLFMLLVYRVNRNEMTYQEVEDAEKEKARRLLAKYPELKDE
jgi:hypothetical protein